LQVIFEGIIGSSYTGDVAIDQVEIIEGSCPGKSMHKLLKQKECIQAKLHKVRLNQLNFQFSKASPSIEYVVFNLFEAPGFSSCARKPEKK